MGQNSATLSRPKVESGPAGAGHGDVFVDLLW
jgi:hypothetical protein